MGLTLKDAQKVLAAAEARAKAIGINVSISVVDARGDLVATQRMDGARWFTPDVARGKATVSATFGAPSGDFAERASGPVFQSLNLMNQGGLVFGQGAVPVNRGAGVEGAVGVSGGSSEQDEDIAKAGLAAL
jgi:uncharacterized protein GlcG (DUF336 family)